MRSIRQTKRHAFALAIVLWIVAALLFGTAMLASLSKDVQSLTRGVDHKLKTQIKAQDFLEHLKFYILTADYSSNTLMNAALSDSAYELPQTLYVDGREYAIAEEILFSVTDTSMLISMDGANSAEIAYLATNSDQRQLRFVIDDSIADWTDKDNIVNLNGAEASRYEQKNVKFHIRNDNAIQDVSELKIINGMDYLSKEEWNAFAPYLYYGRGTQVNIGLLDSKRLAFVLKITDEKAESLIRLRESNFSEFILEVSEIDAFNDEAMGFFQSKQYKITIVAKDADAKSFIETLIDFKPTKEKLYTVIQFVMF